MIEYSTKLIQSLQQYCKEKYNVDVSDGQANEYLDSLADLYLWMERNHKEG